MLQTTKVQAPPATASSRRSIDHNSYEGLALALFEESDDALILFDAKTRHVLDVNAAAQRLCGISVRDLLETPISSLFCSDEWQKIESKSLSTRKNHFPHIEWGTRLRTYEVGNWLSVDVTVTRLVVKPGPLVLLCIRAVNSTVCGGRPQVDTPTTTQFGETDTELESPTVDATRASS